MVRRRESRGHTVSGPVGTSLTFSSRGRKRIEFGRSRRHAGRSRRLGLLRKSKGKNSRQLSSVIRKPEDEWWSTLRPPIPKYL